MSEKYRDIIDLPHHQSDHRPHMSAHDRAAQFSPFAALTGHEAAIREAGRLTESFREPDESQKSLLDEKLCFLLLRQGEKPRIRVEHFVEDAKKSGGAYVETEGLFRKFDPVNAAIVLDSGAIPLDKICDIHSEIFDAAGAEGDVAELNSAESL